MGNTASSCTCNAVLKFGSVDTDIAGYSQGIREEGIF
jgi:hypothetical protein